MHAHFGVDVKQDNVVVMMMKRPALPYRSPCWMKCLYFGVPFPDGLEVVVDVLKKVNNAMPFFIVDGVEESFEARGERGSSYVDVPFQNSPEVMMNVSEKANSTRQLSLMADIFILHPFRKWSGCDDECAEEGW